MKKKKDSPIPFKSNEEIAMYYCKLAGVSFKELKNTIYYKYFLEDCQRLYKKSIPEKNISSITVNNLKPTVLFCKNCLKTFGALFGKEVLLNTSYSFILNNNSLKVKCECGEVNLFNIDEVKNDNSNKKQ